ncbi:MAG: serine protease [Gemmatimonadota bacterium]|nr:serine protease [Gemmatimonadota bacterium]
MAQDQADAQKSGASPAMPAADGDPLPAETQATPLPSAALDADEGLDLEWDQGPVSAAARRMLDRVRSSVVRIRGFYGTNRSEAFHGTAFAVAPGGLLLTNYHVIARAALSPEAYRLEYDTGDGRVGTVSIVVVDVAHDLALVRADKLAPEPLKVRSENPARGDRIYTVGFPLNLGLVITEGIGNGRLENEFSPRLYYAGPMNPGMSGGPALDSRGRVVGINVAFSTRGQLISFLVPAEFVVPLLERAAAPLGASDLRSEVAKQLRNHQAAVLAALPASFPTQTAAGYALPAELAPFVDCTAIAGAPPVKGLLLQSVACRANLALSVEPGLQTGDFQFGHDVLVADRLSPLQFAEQLRQVAAAASARLKPAPYVTDYVCKRDTVNLNRLQGVVTLCVRSYRLYEGLYDVTMVVISLNEPRQGFVSAVTLRGVDFAAGMDFSRRYLRAIRWTR